MADTPEAHHQIADQLVRVGQFAEAENHLNNAISQKPDFGAAHYLLSTIKIYEPDDPHIARLREIIAGPVRDLRNYSRMCFALAKALDQIGNYDEAFAWFDRANEARRQEQPFDMAAEQDRVERRILQFDNALLESLAGCGFNSDKPVFVVGMPRSGSTLVEHIIDTHPDACGIGESKTVPKLLSEHLGRFVPPGADMPDMHRVPASTWDTIGEAYVDHLNSTAPGTKRAVDKQLFNYRLLGEIHLMLPKATFIWCRRDSMDCCLSCFTTAFNNAPAYCGSLEYLGGAYRLHERLMRHWQNIMPGSIREHSYENLVENPESEIRSLLDFIGLDWDPRCLEFHRSSKQVETASQAQVRRPLYQHSIDRWRRYESHLEPLKTALENYDVAI